MYFLISVCQHPGILRVLYFGILILNIVTVIIPIGLIVMLLFDLTKAVVSSNEEGQIKSTKLVGKRIMSAAIVFLIPWIINLIMGILSNLGITAGTNYTTCIENAKGGNFAYYDSLLEEEEKLAEEKRKQQLLQNQNNNNNNNNFQTNAMATELISIIEKEVGNTDSSRYHAHGLPWCAFFVTWAMKSTEIDGVNLFYDIIEKEQKVQNQGGAGCTIYNYNTSSNLKFHYSDYYGKKYDKDFSYIPKAGDTIYYVRNQTVWDGKIPSCAAMYERSGHIGIVHYVEGNIVHTIEGNTVGKKVDYRQHELTSASIMGYGSWYNN